MRRHRPTHPDSARLPELDILRGVAILGVLYLHSYFRMWPEVTQGEMLALRVSHLFAHGAVPVFLFISGLLLTREGTPTPGAFVAGRLRRIAVPGLTWMLAALGYEAWRAGGLSGDLWRRFLLFDVEGQFYFLLVIGMLTAVGYWLRAAPGGRLATATVLAFFAGLVTVAWYERQALTGDLAVFAYRNPLVWAHFFLFGMLAGRLRGGTSWGRKVETRAALGMAVTLGLYLWQGETRGYPTSYFGVTVYVFNSLGVVVYPAATRWLLRRPLGTALARPLGWLAPFSFAIFLVHKPYFLGWMSSTLLDGTRFAESWSRLMLANFAVGTAGTIVFVWAVSRAWPRAAALFLGVDRRSRGMEPEADEARRAA